MTGATSGKRWFQGRVRPARGLQRRVWPERGLKPSPMLWRRFSGAGVSEHCVLLPVNFENAPPSRDSPGFGE